MAQPMPHGNSTGTDSGLRSERDRFVAFAFAAADVLLEVSCEGRIIYAAGAARSMTGRDAASLIGCPFRDLFAETHRDFAGAVLRKVRRHGRMTPVIIAFDRGGESSTNIVLNGCCLPEKDDTLYFTATTQPGPPDPTDLAPRDEETGLLDRSAFQAAAVAALSAAAATRPDPMLALLDVTGIDDLRAQSGDMAVSDLLGEIGNYLSAHALDGTSAGRLAPDRFGVVHDGAQAIDFSGEIVRLSQAHNRSGRGLSVKAQTLQLAPGALNTADVEKALGYTLGRFVAGGVEALSIRSLADGFRELVADTVSRISQFRSSVNEDRLSIVFQPVVDLANPAVHHYEVLSRFEGDRSPAEMIQFAEGVGMIEELDLTVCQRVLAFIDTSRGASEAKLAVNLSGRSLQSDVFVDALGGLLKSLSNRRRLLFEITESSEITDLPRADRIIQDLRRAGHDVCLDDFGAGASSFPYLQALTVDFVKIDGAYVSRMFDAMRDNVILKAMVKMCRDLKTATIAEMIETDAQAQRLAQLGVQYGQGFLFGRPAAKPMGLGVIVSGAPSKTKGLVGRNTFRG